MRRSTATLAILGVIALLGTSATSVAATHGSRLASGRLSTTHHGTPAGFQPASTKNTCFDQITGQVDSGFAVASQDLPDVAVKMMAADDFHCKPLKKIKKLTVLGWYFNCPDSGCLRPDSFNVTLWANDPDDTMDEPADIHGAAICGTNSASFTVTPPDTNPTEHTFVITLSSPYCKIPRGTKWIWLEVQAVGDFGTHGQWGWSLNAGPAVMHDADWKNPDRTVVAECPWYDDDPEGDMEDCIYGGEQGTPDFLFSVN